MKALVFRHRQLPVVEEVAGFKGMQEVIGGADGPATIERITLDWGDPAANRRIELWLNEDGIALGLPPNVWAEGPAYGGAFILGTVILTANRDTADDQEEVDLTEAEVLHWTRAMMRLE